MDQNIDEKLISLGVFTEVVGIYNELQQYKLCPDKICYAMNLLGKTQNYLISIKHKLGSVNQLYINLSTEIVSNALNKIILDVNEAQKEESESYLMQVVYSAWKAIKIMDEFDMADAYMNYYISNKKTLSEIFEQVIWADSVYKELLTIYTEIDIFEHKLKNFDNPLLQDKEAKNVSKSEMVAAHIMNPFSLWDSSLFSKVSPISDPELDCMIKFEHIETFLKKCIESLSIIEAKSSMFYEKYINLSTRIASMVLDNIVRIVNNAFNSSSSISHFNNGLLLSVVSKAYSILLIANKLDLNSAFKNHFEKQVRELEILLKNISCWEVK